MNTENTDWRNEIEKKWEFMTGAELISYIKSLLKEQRENYEEQIHNVKHKYGAEGCEALEELRIRILNAPEPSGVKK